MLANSGLCTCASQHIHESWLTLFKRRTDGTAVPHTCEACGSGWLPLLHAFSIADSLWWCLRDASFAELFKRPLEVGMLMCSPCFVLIHYFWQLAFCQPPQSDSECFWVCVMDSYIIYNIFSLCAQKFVEACACHGSLASPPDASVF